MRKVKLDTTLGLQIHQMIRFGIVFLINILLVKLSLSTKDIGYYEITLFISNILTFFWVNGFIQTLLTENPELNKHARKADLFNIFLIIFVFSIISGILGLLLKSFFVKFQGVEDIKVFNLIILYTSLNAPTQLIEHIYLLKKEPKTIIRYGLISNTLQLILVILPIFIGYPITFSIVGLVLIAGIKTLWLLYLVLSLSKAKISINKIFNFLKTGIPLSLRYLVSSSGSYVDGVIISSRFDASTFALYRYGARDIPIITILANALSNSMLPKFSETNDIKILLQEIKTRSLKLMHWLFPISIVLLLLTKPLFPIVFNEQFIFSANIFLIFILLVTSRTLFPQTILIGLKKANLVLAISIVELILNISLSILLLNLIGIEGVALSTAIVYLLEKILLVFYLKLKMKINFNDYTPINYYIAYSSLLIIVFITVRFFI